MTAPKRQGPRSKILTRLVFGSGRSHTPATPTRNAPGIKKIRVPEQNATATTGIQPERISERSVWPWGSRVVKFVSKRHRLGQKVTLKEPRLSETERKLDVERIRMEIEKLERGGGHLTKREMRAQQPQLLIYSTCAELAKTQNGIKPNIFQLVSAFAFYPELGGIMGKKFRDLINEMHYLYRKTPAIARGSLPWVGEPSNIIRILGNHNKRMNLPLRAWNILRRARGKIFSTSELLEAMGLPNTRRNQNVLNTTMQFIDLLGFTRKHPLSNGQAQWSSAHEPAIKRHVSNCYLHVLETVASVESLRMNDLGARYNNGFKPEQLSHSADRLAQIGLLHIEVVPLVGQRNTKRFTLTPLGKELLQGWLSTPLAQPLQGTAYERLRRKLLDLE